ncbi:hypothetical protein BGX29_008118 [Mortierella sp. GBA35]|nr:hypothetical protein BGX29_008118 [Mortierella sp. GBA35]
MSNSRRGSLAVVGGVSGTAGPVDPQQQHLQAYPTDRDMIYRRPSIAVHDTYSSSNLTPTTTSPLPPPSNGNNGSYYNSNLGVNGSASPGPGSGAQPQGGTSPTQLRHAEMSAAQAAAAAGGRRESLPSIYSSAGPLGQLLAQEPARRHSIAHHHIDPLLGSASGPGPLTSAGGGTGGGGGSHLGPLKRKSSGTRLSQVHLSDSLEHPAKRRDSIPDAGNSAAAASAAAAAASHSQGYPYPNHGHHQSHLPSHHHRHGPYPPRSSFSAPSSPPRRGSVAPTVPVPTLNLQPAAEIKSSPSFTFPGTMEYGRPQFLLHQPRRPSLLSEVGSRRSSVADILSPFNNVNGGSPGGPPSTYPPHEYDNRMNMDMERMNLSSQGPEPLMKGGVPPQQSPGGVQGPGGQHLYPSYVTPNNGGAPGSSPTSNNNNITTTTTTPPGDLLGLPRGETPYSRTPELKVSHKLAERKRRKEMKELFDELRDALPVDRSLKTSKWEILSKAVDYIASIKEEQEGMAKEVEALRQEVSRLQQQKQQHGQQHPHYPQQQQHHQQQHYHPHSQQQQ